MLKEMTSKLFEKYNKRALKIEESDDIERFRRFLLVILR